MADNSISKGRFKVPPRKSRQPVNVPLRSDILRAVVVTIIGAAIAYVLAGGLSTFGIDDAAITRSYSENIARGAGYVYNIGGERVEGSTAFLWASMVAGLYFLTPTPELLIIGLCAIFTGLSVLAACRLAGYLALWCDGDAVITRRVLSITFIATPGYFLWSVWTMMELALWAAAIIGLVLCLARVIESTASPFARALAVILGFMLPMIRPEGIAVGFGLGIVALCLSPRHWKPACGVSVAAAVSFCGLTAFRLSYFGQPFPNTFYAKVSSDLVDGLKDGLHYLAGFILGAPFVDLLMLVCVGMAICAIGRMRSRLQGGRALILALLTIWGALLVYAALGGDHFVLWRFYQPVMPLLIVIFAVAFGMLVARMQQPPAPIAVGLVGTIAVAFGWVHYIQNRYQVQSEFSLVEKGTAFGTYLNAADPRPVIGVGPAGGIALAYDGVIRDLLGLNWTEMAHANPVKVGMRNHASFDLATFWKYQPDVVATFNRSCARTTPDGGFDGLFQMEKFRAAFVPVQFNDGAMCWPGYATPEWIGNVQLDGLVTLDWAAMPSVGE